MRAVDARRVVNNGATGVESGKASVAATHHPLSRRPDLLPKSQAHAMQTASGLFIIAVTGVALSFGTTLKAGPSSRSDEDVNERPIVASPRAVEVFPWLTGSVPHRNKPGSASHEETAPTNASGFSSARFTNSVGMELAGIPAGYWVGVYEVTQDEYEKVIRHNPSEFKGGRFPVDSVSWNEAMTFCRKLTELDRQAGILPEGYAYALPTQQQWEHFVADARLEDAVTSQKERRVSTAAVGSRQPNKYGLYGTRGNLWEWCGDVRGVLDASRVLRGGAWDTSFEGDLRLAFRFYARGPDDHRNIFGFRCVLIRKGSAR